MALARKSPKEYRFFLWVLGNDWLHLNGDK